MADIQGMSNSGFDKVKAAHQKITEQTWLLQNSLPSLAKEDSYNNVKRVLDFFKNVMFKHFEWEEQDIFPLALAMGDLNIKLMVRELQQQHIVIISRFDVIADIIIQYGFSINDKKAEIKDRFVLVSKEMADLILAHAQKEDIELYPFLESRKINIKF